MFPKRFGDFRYGRKTVTIQSLLKSFQVEFLYVFTWLGLCDTVT